MSALPLDRYQRMRLDVGLAPDDIASLPDAVIDDAYLRAEALYSNPTSQNAAAHVVILEQLWAKSATATDYTQNASSEKASQRFDHYGKLLDGWRKALDSAAGSLEGAGVVRSGRSRHKPARLEEYPDVMMPPGRWGNWPWPQ